MLNLKLNRILKYILVMSAVFSFTISEAQQIFQKEYYGGDVWTKILENNNGYFFAGHSLKLGNNAHQIYIYHIDHSGNIIWAKHFGKISPVGEFIYDYTFSDDSSSIVFVGSSHYSPSYQNILIFKTDLNGNLQWHKSLGDSIINSSRCIYAYKGHYYIGGGAYYTNNGAGGLAMLLKLDENGNIIFEKFYSFPNDLVGVLGIYRDSSNIYMTGSWYDYVTEERDVIFLKVDTLGNLILSKKFGSNDIDQGYSIIHGYDENLIIAGATWGFGNVYRYFTRITKNGDIIWTKIVEDGISSTGYGPEKTRDSGYVFTLGSAQIVKTDSLFNIEWASRFSPGFLFRSLSNAQETKDGGIIAGGNVNNTFNSLIIKIDSLLDGGCNQNFPPINVYNIFFNEDTLPLIEVFPGLIEIFDSLPNYSIQNPSVTYCQTATHTIEYKLSDVINVFPNPFQDHFYVKGVSNYMIKSISIVDQLGNLMPIKTNSINEYLIMIREITPLPSGIYFLKVESESNLVYSKLLKL